MTTRAGTKSGAKKRTRPRPIYRFVKPDLLRFDATNPRLGLGKKSPLQEDLQKTLQAPPHLALQLTTSLGENGFIPYEPLVVREDGDHFTVIEGNRRLAAVKHILAHPDQFDADTRQELAEIPVLIVPSETPSEEVRTYLAVHHLLGFKDWPPLSKALFLNSQIKSRGDVARLVEEFGIDKQEIRRFLVPYRLLKAAGSNVAHLAEMPFWILGEALQRTGIKAYVGLDLDAKALRVKHFNRRRFNYLLEFLYGNGQEGETVVGLYGARGRARISDTRQLSSLAKVLGSPKARKELERGCTLDDAAYHVDEPAEASGKVALQIERLLARLAKLKPSRLIWERIQESLDKHKPKQRD